MRDIRSDLQERADSIEEQIRAASAHFEKMVQQLQSERDVKVAELKSWLAGIGKVMEAEHRRMNDVLTLTTPEAPPQLSLADRIRKTGRG
jgi:enamine deaminase RidA (YjgF/YER057c/UK114 family)